MIPQFIVLGLMCLSLGIEMARHGKPKEGNHSFFIQLTSSAITFSILYWGGFFKGLF